MFFSSDNKGLVELKRYLRRVTDLTTPNRASAPNCARTEDRYNRAIPTLLSPWEGNRVDRSRCAMVLTRDISDRGVGLIAHHPFPAREVVLAYWLSIDDAHEPWFFQGTVQRQDAIGGGFWTIGVELAEFMNERRRHEMEPLLPLAHKLRPPLRDATGGRQNEVEEFVVM